MDKEGFDPVALLKEHPSLGEIREALAVDEVLCQQIHEACSEMVEQVPNFPAETRKIILFLAGLMTSGEHQPLLGVNSGSEEDTFWTRWAAYVFLFNEVEPALRQHMANRLEAAFAPPPGAPSPEVKRTRF